eukprot:gene4678-8250_t
MSSTDSDSVDINCSFETYTENTFYCEEDKFMFGTKIPLTKRISGNYNSENFKRVICFKEYQYEEAKEFILPQNRSKNFEKLIYLCQNKKQQEIKYIYEAGIMNLDELILKIDKFEENEIGTIINFYLKLTKEVDFLFFLRNPDRFQFHENKIKFLFHEEILHPRRDSMFSDYFLSPEKITEQQITTKKSMIWRLGILCLLLADLEIPRSDMHPMRALFIIAHREPPELKCKSDWSTEFNDFISKCLQKNPQDRSTVDELLNHSFLTVSLTEEDFIDKFQTYKMDWLLLGLLCGLLMQNNNRNNGPSGPKAPIYSSSKTKAFNLLSWISGCFLCCCVIPCACCFPILFIVGISAVASPGNATGSAAAEANKSNAVVMIVTSSIGTVFTVVVLVITIILCVVFLYVCIKSNKADKVIELDLQTKFYESQKQANQVAPTVVVVQTAPTIVQQPSPVQMQQSYPQIQDVTPMPQDYPIGAPVVDSYPQMQN